MWKYLFPLPPASYLPERCRAGGGQGDRSFLVLIGSRCHISKTGDFQGVLLFFFFLSLPVHVNPRSWSLSTLLNIVSFCVSAQWESSANMGWSWGCGQRCQGMDLTEWFQACFLCSLLVWFSFILFCLLWQALECEII